jgi:hypothetical protein
LRANDIKSAFIYGPYAEGEDTPTVDLIVIGSFTPALLIGLHDIEKNFGKRINCTVIEEAEYKLKKRKDASVKRILAEKRITLLGRI